MSDNKNRGLGKGLDALFGTAEPFDTPLPVNSEIKNGVSAISMHLIDRNMDQPRQEFDKEKLEELAASIQVHGVLQPILLTQKDGRYLLVAGERRWRASKIAGLTEIPAIIKTLSPIEIAQIALIENLQRDDLNPIEEAKGIKNLMSEYGLTQEEVSKTLSKSRSAIANTVRLLNLPDYIINYIKEGSLSAGHGRCLVAVSNSQLQKKLCDKAINENLNVRQLESLVQKSDINSGASEKKSKDETQVSTEINEFKERLQKTFGLKIDLKGNFESGKITINYTSREELENFYNTIKKLKK